MAFHNGLLMLACGVSMLRLVPPLTVSGSQIAEARVLLEVALTEALEGS